jgi:polysaccharide biosynthesis PFTS motif protein
MIFEYALYAQSALYAHEHIDHVFDEYFSFSPSIKNMEKLLENPEIKNMYKHRLLQELRKIYEIELKINEIVKNKKNAEIHFVPCDSFMVHSDAAAPLSKKVKVIFASGFRVSIERFINRLKNMIWLGVPIYVFFKKVRRIVDKKQRKHYRVGIMIPPHPRSIFSLNYLTETIFLNKNELSKNDVLFIDNRGQVNLEGYKKREYHYTRLLNDKESISTDLFWRKIVKRLIPTWLKSICFSFFEEAPITKTNIPILFDYIVWNIFVDCYEIDNYVKRLQPDNLSKLHILSQAGVKTWIVYPDNTSPDYHLDWDENKRNQTLCSFMYFDNAVIYGDAVERFYRKHRNQIKNYIKVGVILSQIVQELRGGKLKSPIFDIMRKKGLPKKVIGVFDTTYVNYGPVKVKDGVRFGEDILKLLNELPEIGIVFLAKKELKQRPPELNPIYDKLKNHERCLFFSRWDKEGISAPEVIAVSDLVISAPYTSAAAEALGARIKAMYYDAAGRDIGDKYYFNRLPNFVAHNYEELKKLVNYWLYKITDKEFKDFLNKYIKDEMDPYLDGMALTRVRKMLRGHG